MIEALVGVLAWVNQWADPLAWLVIATFTAGTLLEWSGWHDEWARRVTVGAWVLFSAFWFIQIYHFAVVQKSFVEGIGTLVAVPASLYVGYLLANGRDSLFVLSRSIAIMGLVFLPFETMAVLRQPLVETVTRQTEFLMGLLGYHPEVIQGTAVSPDYDPFRSTFQFHPAPDHKIRYTILLACTGLGSMAIFVGLIGAVRAPMGRKLRALAVSVPVIYALNLVRNVFIGLSFGKQYLQLYPDLVLTLFASSDPYRVSYFLADRVIAQVLSVGILVGITWLVVRELPEVLVIVEDLLYLLTGTEYDLESALGVGTVSHEAQAVRADGE